MKKFDKTKITAVGQQMLLDVDSGKHKIKYTRVVAYDQKVDNLSDNQIEQIVSLSDQKLSAEIRMVSQTDISFIINASFSNKDLTSKVEFNTVGWFAKYDDDTDEKLFAISPASETQTLPANETQTLVAGSQNPRSTTSIDLQLAISISNAKNVTVEATDAGLATLEDLHTSETNAQDYMNTNFVKNYSSSEIGINDAGLSDYKDYETVSIRAGKDGKHFIVAPVDYVQDQISKTVRNINGVSPDKYGNVNINVGATGEIFIDKDGAKTSNISSYFPFVGDNNDPVARKSYVDDQVSKAGKVKSVNGKTGDVRINTGVMSVNDNKPDSNGNIDLTKDFVSTRNNGLTLGTGSVTHNFATLYFTDEQGKNNVFLAPIKYVDQEVNKCVKTINHEAGNEYGNINIDTGVMSVNDNKPDSSGNIDLTKDFVSVDGDKKITLKPETMYDDLETLQVIEKGGRTYDLASMDLVDHKLDMCVKSVNHMAPGADGDVDIITFRDIDVLCGITDFGSPIHDYLTKNISGRVTNKDDDMLPITKGYLDARLKKLEKKIEDLENTISKLKGAK